MVAERRGLVGDSEVVTIDLREHQETGFSWKARVASHDDSRLPAADETDSAPAEREPEFFTLSLGKPERPGFEPPADRLKHDYSSVIGRSPAMLSVLERVDRATGSDVPVLLQGESGTGKELIARCLHRNGPRAAHPFVAINCAAIPETLLESELFGHVRGAFTGAHCDRAGLLAKADRGTLLLDEIGEMTPMMQVKLLRALQEREVCPVGGSATRRFDVRLVCATNRDLSELVGEGRFREDLFYRVNVFPIELPPLRRRLADLPELCRHFLRTTGKSLSREALGEILRYPWPGNVRELANVLERAGVLTAGVSIRREALDLPEPPVNLPCPLEPLDRFMERAVRAYLLEILRHARWNRRRAASLLNVDRSTLYRLMKKHRISAAPSLRLA